MNIYFPLIMMVIAFLASITIYMYPNREKYLRLFPFFLLLCAVSEILSDYLTLHNRSNLYISNPLTIITCSYYCLTIYWIIQSRKVKKIIIGVLIIYPISSFLNILFIQGTHSFHTVTYSIGCLIIVALSIYYFLELFQLTRTLNLVRQPAFWICSGLLFYYSCTFPLYGVTNIIPQAVVNNLLIVFQLLDVLLYLSFTIAFLCRVRVRKSTL